MFLNNLGIFGPPCTTMFGYIGRRVSSEAGDIHDV